MPLLTARKEGMEKEREVRLFVSVETPRHGGEFFCVSACPVYLGENGEIREFQSGPLAGLHVEAQGDLHEPRPVYGWRVCYRDSGDIDLTRGEEIVRQLRRIERRLEALEERFAAPETFAQFLIRVGQVLKVERFGFERDELKRTLIGGRYVWRPGMDVGFEIDRRIRQLRELVAA